MESGPSGLYDLTRANRQVANRAPRAPAPHIEKAVISIRKRLAKRATNETRYGLVGATQIRSELEKLDYTPLPSVRTIERIVNQAGLSCPPLRLASQISRTEYPGPQPQSSNQVHQVDFVGPRYLKGDRKRYYFLCCRDVFDQAVYMEFTDSRSTDTVLAFLVKAWQQLGIPEIVQFDNGREFCGWGKAGTLWVRSLGRVIRFGLRLDVEVLFIPEGMPCYNGSVEQFNGWFGCPLGGLLMDRTYKRPSDVRRQLKRLMISVNDEHVHAHLGHKTVAAYRRGKLLRKLPADCQLHEEKLPVSVGKVSFIRLVKATVPSIYSANDFKSGVASNISILRLRSLPNNVSSRFITRGALSSSLIIR